jgi:beta-lactamase regulating signal transducer with metallopeptidase domain
VATLLSFVFSNTVAAIVLALIAAAVSKIVRRPALTHALWVMVLLKLFTPPVWTIPVRLAPTPTPSVATDERTQVPVESREVTSNAAATTANPPPGARMQLLTLAPVVLTFVWFAGGALYLAIAAARLARFSRLLKFARPAPANAQEQARDLARQIGLRRCPRVWFLPGPICPMLWAPGTGVRLLIPSELWDRLSLRQRAGLLLHELAHLKRGDHWVRGLELIVTALYWWNPLVWWARHDLREAEEQCCDAWVTWALPAGNHDYASALVEAVEFASTPNRITPRSLPALASGIGEFRHLKRRLIMIQQGNGNRNLGTTGTLCVCAAFLLLPLALSRAQQAERAPSNTRSAGAPTQPTAEPEVDPLLRKQLDHQLPDLQFDGVGLNDVIDFLRDVSGANIVVNWKSLEAAGVEKNTLVTAKLRNIKFSKALNVFLDSAGGGSGVVVWRAEGNIITITAGSEGGKVVQRTYDVHDLVADGGKADSLLRMITGSIDADSWKDNGGKTGTIKLEAGKLVVTQTEANQKSISNLLARTRELLKDRH